MNVKRPCDAEQGAVVTLSLPSYQQPRVGSSRTETSGGQCDKFGLKDSPVVCTFMSYDYESWKIYSEEKMRNDKMKV